MGRKPYLCPILRITPAAGVRLGTEPIRGLAAASAAEAALAWGESRSTQETQKKKKNTYTRLPWYDR